MIKMRLVNVLIDRLDSNLKDLTETHDKKLKRTSTELNDASDDTPKKMKLDYFPITMNVSPYCRLVRVENNNCFLKFISERYVSSAVWKWKFELFVSEQSMQLIKFISRKYTHTNEWYEFIKCTYRFSICP